jgi:serine/threonine protein kinase
MINDNNIIKVYGISQNPGTGDYIIVLYYAAGGNFNDWINKNDNYKSFNWKKKLEILINIAHGLKGIHERQLIHHNFHTRNILFDFPFANKTYISDMGLCKEIGNKDKTKFYGNMPYMAPEVLRGKPYTQAADIYSFGMIMYFVATERKPFDNCEHDIRLALDICKGIRPEISEPKAPKCYIELMKKCWNSNPENRPNIYQLINSLLSISDNDSEIEKAEIYRNFYLSSLMENKQTATYSQAIYSSQLLNSYTENFPKDDDNNSECLDCAI